MRFVIFANGVLNQPDLVLPRLRKDDFIVAADGGAHHCRELGLVPGLIVGDMDSLSPEQIQDVEILGAEIEKHPVHKDQTDLELAIRRSLEMGADDILIFGALGQRWDMTLANVMLLATSHSAGVRIRLIDGPDEIQLLEGGKKLILHGSPGDRLSLIPIETRAEGITLTNLRYPLNDEDLPMGSTRGISNYFMGETAIVRFNKGRLLVVVTRFGSNGTV